MHLPDITKIFKKTNWKDVEDIFNKKAYIKADFEIVTSEPCCKREKASVFNRKTLQHHC